MAYSYVTGPYSAVYYPPSSSVGRKIRARLYYQITETATTYKIDAYGQGTIYKDNVGCTLYGKLNLTGKSEITGNHVYHYSSSGTNHTEVYYTMCSGMSRTWNKTTSTQSATASMYVYWSSSDANSKATKTFTIPALKKYSVTFNANGQGTAPATQSIYHGYKATKPTDPTATGYTFGGWYTDAACTSTKAWNWNTAITSAITLYAKWTLNKYAVTYNANGGTGAISTQYQEHGSSINLYTASGASGDTGFSRELHTLMNWNTRADGAGTTYSFGSAYSANAAVTLYAQWRNDYTAATLTNCQAYRVKGPTNSQNPNTPSDDSGYIRIMANYTVSKLISSYSATQPTNLQNTITVSINGSTVKTETKSAPGSIDFITSGTYPLEQIHTITITITDSYNRSVSNTLKVARAIYPIDLYGMTDSNNTKVYMGVMHPYVTGQQLTITNTYVDGDVYLVTDNNAAVGTVDQQLSTALTALGWS